MTKKEFFEEWLKHDKSERNSGVFYSMIEKINTSDVSNDSLKRLNEYIKPFSKIQPKMDFFNV